MDTTAWGPPMWALALDVAKFCDPASPEVAAFLSSWKRVLPCVWCRLSYRKFYAARPPPAGKRARGASVAARKLELLTWLHWLKCQVNNKLTAQNVEIGITQPSKPAFNASKQSTPKPPTPKSPSPVCGLSLEKLILRRDVWSSFSHASWVWDVLYMVACNYPLDAVRPKNDQEAEKLAGYARFYPAVVRLSADIPYLRQSAVAMKNVVWSSALPGRDNLLKALHSSAVQSGAETRDLATVLDIYSKCNPSKT
jgi:hypothetical protein